MAASERAEKPIDDRALKRRLSIFIAAVAALLTANNFLPYLGMRDDSCQTMFSGLEWSAETNNHAFMPQHATSDLWRYWVDVHAELDPPVPGPGHVADLEAWLNQEDRVLNDEALRVVVDQICDRGHRVALSRRRSWDLPVERYENACDAEALAPRRYLPVRLYETDLPDPRAPAEDAP